MKKRNKCKTGMKRYVLLFMLFFVIGSYAQNGQQLVFNGVSSEKIEVSVTQDDLVAIEPERLGEGLVEAGLISLNVRGGELRNVIRIFTELSGANIIIPEMAPELAEAKIDVNLTNVQWRPALQAVLSTLELELFEQIPGSEVYSVRRRAADAPEPMTVKTFRLNHASVSGVSDMIRSLIPEPGKISVFPARNTIIVQSTAQVLIEISEIINSVDLPRQQVFIEAKFLELSDSASEKLGIDWQVLGGYNLGIQGIGGSFEYGRSRTDRHDRMYDMAGNQYEDYAWRERMGTTTYERSQAAPTFTADPTNPGSYILSYDNPPTYTLPPWINPATAQPSDYIRAGDAPVFTEDPTNPGQYIRTDGAPTFTADPSSTIYDRIVNTPTRMFGRKTSASTAFGATLSADDFNVVLAALRETGGSKVVSNPRVIVANEETAQIYIGTREPNIRQTTTQVENTAPITTFNLDPDRPFFEYGIKLDVTPTVNTADNISVAITPSLMRLVERKVVAGNTYPVTSEKTINTLFSMQSGQTAAIGGLTETGSNDIQRKVPILGSLPLIGRFFSYSEKSNRQTETVIFVTVGLANPENIDMDTGMPSETVLALRHHSQMHADREIRAEELRVFREHQAARAAAAVQALRDAEAAAVDAQ